MSPQGLVRLSGTAPPELYPSPPTWVTEPSRRDTAPIRAHARVPKEAAPLHRVRSVTRSSRGVDAAAPLP
jgi:hypothetical protein